jgi:UDP-N-acetylmuramate dehydrogenase
MEEILAQPLWRYTTLKIGGPAERVCMPTSIEEVLSLMDRLRKEGKPWFVIGGGSNLLVSSSGFAGTVIRTTQITAITEPAPGLLEAGAGARLPHLARYAANLGLSGLEFSVGIPGTVGGGVVMNAGAHGSCIANVIESVTVFDSKTGQVEKLSHADLNFQYRKSAINPDTQIVLSACFRLNPDSADAIKERIRHNEDYRWQTQPLNWPNAGSTFKNPEPTRGAGLLLDQSGAKQFREGQAAVSSVHANFVINMGNATSQEVTTLLARMQDSVYENFQVVLHPEWKRLGLFTPSECKIWNGEA